MRMGSAREGSIIVDSNGKKIIRNGIECPLSDEEYRRLNPIHRDSGCTECVFAESKRVLFVWLIAREVKELANSEPLFCGKFYMPDWTGHSSFYIFRCRECGNLTVDYPHGYRGDFLFVRCDDCRAEIILNPRKYREIYDRDSLYVPKELTFREKRRMARLAKEKMAELEKIRDMGIVPLGYSVRPEKTLKQKLFALFGFKT